MHNTNTTIVSFIRNAVITAINDNCQCDFQEVYITNEQLHCDLSYPTLANYRAKITRR